MALQATELDLYMHMMGGFSADKAREALNIPEGYEAVTMIALGYKGEPEQLPAQLKEREEAPRNRKPLQELVFNGTWKS
jgi:nitroreductase